LIHDFFFTDNTRLSFDLRKITLFAILYCGGTEIEKITFLFNIIETSNSGFVHSNSQKMTSAFEYLTFISCIMVGEVINGGKRFTSD
jgi:hypothetical protein